jgi:16S rRNA (guanine527-N7)-methyltransferase
LRSGAFDLIVSRAFAPLGKFVVLTRQHLAPNGTWLAMKGKSSAAELGALPEDIEVFHVEPLEVPELNADRCLVWMRRRWRQ